MQYVLAYGWYLSCYELVRVWVHFVFSTKNRYPFLNAAIRKNIFEHIKQNAIEKGIWVDRINGYTDHCHCLVSLAGVQSISKVAQLLKGESSHWINKNALVEGFTWQDDFFAVSVSESQLDIIRNYIDNQEIHHRQKSFQEEYQEFLNKYKFSPSAKADGNTS